MKVFNAAILNVGIFLVSCYGIHLKDNNRNIYS
jgi:hypothetical protein